MKSHKTGLNLFPIKSTATEEKEDTFDRATRLMVTSMVTIHHANETVWEVHRHKFWMVKVNTESVIAINDTPRVDDRAVGMGGKKSDHTVEASKSSSRRTLGVTAKTGECKSKFKATPNVDVHELTEDFRVSTAIALDERLKLRWGRWEVFHEFNFKGGVSAKGSVHRFETLGGGRREELVNDGLEDVFRLIKRDAVWRLYDAKVEVFQVGSGLRREVEHAAEMVTEARKEVVV